MIDSNVIHSKCQIKVFFNPTEYWIFKPDDIISDLDERVHPGMLEGLTPPAQK